MRTTISMPDDKAKIILRGTGAKTLSQAMLKVAEEMEYREKAEAILAMAGTMKFRYSWQEVKALNREREGRLFGKSAH